MSGTMTPMAGMGTTGATLGSGSMFSPAMIQMLLQRAQMMGGNGASPMQPGGAVTPMTMGMGQHAMPPQMGPQMGAPPNPAMQQGAPGAGGAGNPMASLMGNPQMLQQLLNMLKGGQSGVNPLQGSGAASMLGNLLHGFSPGGIPGAGVLDSLSSQAAGNVAGGMAGY